ncbi:hypothetical protein HRR78_006847 [Exophiala dermatitidis]|nr:hypothetical protein HRR75_006553 [Exophiala dermatitidis]KAJ4542758.1 hypothetical protein HRR78_006847 [Exophiala dermatitidis]
MSFIRRIVHNSAVKVDPPEVYNWRACFGGTLFGMDIGIIGGVLTLPDFKEYVHMGSKFDTWDRSLIKFQ